MCAGPEPRAELFERLRRGAVDDRVERSSPIARKTGNEVDVEVRDGLSGLRALVYAYREPRGSDRLRENRKDAADGEEERGDTLLRQIEKGLGVNAGHDERVRECERVNVEKGDRALVLVENLRRDIAHNNRAEETSS